MFSSGLCTLCLEKSMLAIRLSRPQITDFVLNVWCRPNLADLRITLLEFKLGAITRSAESSATLNVTHLTPDSPLVKTSYLLVVIFWFSINICVGKYHATTRSALHEATTITRSDSVHALIIELYDPILCAQHQDCWYDLAIMFYQNCGEIGAEIRNTFSYILCATITFPSLRVERILLLLCSLDFSSVTGYHIDVTDA